MERFLDSAVTCFLNMALLVQILVLCLGLFAAESRRIVSHEERRTAAALGVDSIDYYEPGSGPIPSARRLPRRRPYRYHPLIPYYVDHWYAEVPRPYADPRPVDRPDSQGVKDEKDRDTKRQEPSNGKGIDPAADFAKFLSKRPENERPENETPENERPENETPQDQPALAKYSEPSETEEDNWNGSKDSKYAPYPVGAVPEGSNQQTNGAVFTNGNAQPIPAGNNIQPPTQVHYVLPQNLIPVTNPNPQYTLVSIPNNGAYNPQPNIYYIANQPGTGGYQVPNQVQAPTYIMPNNQPAQLVPINTNQPQYVILNPGNSIQSQPTYVALNQGNGIPSGNQQYVTLQPVNNGGPY